VDTTVPGKLTASSFGHEDESSAFLQNVCLYPQLHMTSLEIRIQTVNCRQPEDEPFSPLSNRVIVLLVIRLQRQRRAMIQREEAVITGRRESMNRPISHTTTERSEIDL
jgi:hypothetical protein